MSNTEADTALAPLPPRGARLLHSQTVTAAQVCLGRPLEVRTVVEGLTGLSKLWTIRGVRRGDLLLGRSNGPTWRRLSAESANPVKTARGFATRLLSQVAKTDREHVDDVVLAASELVTNALRHALGTGPIWIGLAVRDRWTHLYVTDPDPTMSPAAPGDDELALCGRGLPIVEQLGLLWFVVGVAGKTAHVVITRAGEKLTGEERDALMRLSIV